MSIVEKAIAKLQSGGSDESRPQSPPQVLRPAVQTFAPPPVSQTRATEPAAEIKIVAGSSIVVDMKVLQDAGMLPPDNGALLVRNQFRRLKWTLLDEVESARNKGLPQAGALMISSALPGEGKTFTSVNLVMSLAREENHRVILVDADVAKGHVSALFGLRDRPGLVDLLTDTKLNVADVLVETDIQRLFILPAGKFRSDVPELMASSRMQQVINELIGGDRRRVVVFDTSPVLATNAAQVLARMLPQILMVVRAEHTSQAAVLDAVELLDKTKVAAVLNQSHFAASNDNYNQGYGYYGKEG